MNNPLLKGIMDLANAKIVKPKKVLNKEKEKDISRGEQAPHAQEEENKIQN